MDDNILSVEKLYSDVLVASATLEHFLKEYQQNVAPKINELKNIISQAQEQHDNLMLNIEEKTNALHQLSDTVNENQELVKQETQKALDLCQDILQECMDIQHQINN